MSQPPTAAPLTVVSVSAEVAPWSKVGGLADVASALPVALAERGHRVLGVAPRHAAYDDAWDTGLTARFGLFGQRHEVRFFHARVDGVDRVFVDHPAIRRGGVYGTDQGGYADNLLRFALLSRAALVAPALLPGFSLPTDGADTVFLAHDWHAGLVPLYLAARYRHHGLLSRARSILVVHNLAHQGRYAPGVLPGLDLEARWRSVLDMDGHVNVLKGGIAAADRVATVSPRYAHEITTPEHGFGLDPILRMRGPVPDGIRNGLDTRSWDPATDPHLPANFSADDLSGKAACKAALQQELGLPVDPTAPLVGCVGRLDAQKGIDVLLPVLPWLRDQGAQVVVLGSGSPLLQDALRRVNGDRVRVRIGFDGPLSRRITAASDLFVVPSRFEPCGLTQIQAMRYGAVPVVAGTGGLFDTVPPYDPVHQQGHGFRAWPGSAESLRHAFGDALYTWRHWPDSFAGLRDRGMRHDWSWNLPAAAWEQAMTAALDAPAWA
ncbi:MAG: glycogen synthase [Alphaproteobacteria bacterium]|nr:glycogen synthase [Alphaproteobacteria bacterium]